MAIYKTPQGAYFDDTSGSPVAVSDPNILKQLSSNPSMYTLGNPFATSQSQVPLTTPSSINSSITSTPNPNFQTSTSPSIYPVATLSPLQQKEQTLSEQTQTLTQQLLGESVFKTQEEITQGLPALKQTQQDLTSQLNTLKAEAASIPLQLQQQAQGRGITTGGLQPLETGALRQNAIQALSVSAMLQATQGNIATALDLVDRAVAQKYDPIREQIAVNKANLNLIITSPQYSLEVKNRARQQDAIQDAIEKQTATDAKNFEEAQKSAINLITLNPNVDSLTVSELRKAETPFDVLNIARNKGLVIQKPEKLTGQSDFEQAFLRQYGRLPNIDELIDFKRREAAAGRAPIIGNRITLTESRNQGLPPNVVGLSEQQVAQDLVSSTPPQWFREYEENRVQQSLMPQELKRRWDTFRTEQVGRTPTQQETRQREAKTQELLLKSENGANLDALTPEELTELYTNL